MQPEAAKPYFGRNASVALDVLRFLAALAVALSHMPLHYVAAAPIISEHSGNLAVCVFFVLSGFVIRYVTQNRSTTGREYWIDRVSRMYSVVLPMLLLTFVLEPAAAWWSPTVYRSMVIPFTWSEIPGELFHNLTFTVGWWDWGTPPLSNGPFWSLSYECMYYALYGIWCFLPRSRWFLIPALLLASGPGILLLLPVWLLGVALHDAYQCLHGNSRAFWLTLAGASGYTGLLAFLRKPILRFLLHTTNAARAAALTHFISTQPWGQQLVRGGTELHWLDHFSLSFGIVGTLFCALVLPLLLLLDGYVPALPKSIPARVRLIADSTFPLYLLHWPLFLFIVCVHGGPIATWRGGSIMLAGAIIISIVLARAFDWLKKRMRMVLRRQASPAMLNVLHPAL